MTTSDHALCTFRVAGLSQTLLVERWHGTEAVSRPYRFEVTLACADFSLDPEDMLGERATLAVWVDTQPRPWHGVLTQVTLLDPDEEHLRFQVVLEPRLALLREFHRSEVFIEKDLGGLIRLMLGRINLEEKSPDPGATTANDYEIRVSTDTLGQTRQSFTCQFEETTLDFLSRRLEREGVYYWFEQGEDAERVVFGDAMYQQPSEVESIVWRPLDTIDPERDLAPVVSLRYTLDNTQTKVQLRTFAARRADLDLTVTAEVPVGEDNEAEEPELTGEYTMYGEHYSSLAQGRRLAGIRAEALATKLRRYIGRSRAPGLRAGLFAQLSEHPLASLNLRYYIVSVQHSGSQPLPGKLSDTPGERNDYANDFVAIPANVQFRAPQTTRRPRIIGMLSALIDAQGEGKYAELNDNGCYKVVFPFSRTHYEAASNSAWVRMATPYAGRDHGMHLPLLKGTEVLVTFLSGDPDRPVIAAAVTNSDNPNRLGTRTATQPGLRTSSGNALAFEDREGKESVLLGSPVAASQISVGTLKNAPKSQGIALRSTQHMNLVSTSYQHEVPGLYKMQVFGVGDASAPAAPSGTPATGGQPAASTASPAAALAQPATAKDDNPSSDTSDTPATTPTPPPWYTAEGWDITLNNLTGGVMLTTFVGSATDVKFGNINTYAVGFKTEIDVGFSLSAKMTGSVTFNLSDRGEFTFTKYEKATPVKDETIGAYTGHYVTVDHTIGTLGHTLGSYTAATATSYTVAAGLSLELSSMLHKLSLTPDLATLTGVNVGVGGQLRTALSTPTAQTAIAGTAIQIGDSTTVNIHVRSASFSGEYLGRASMQAMGPMSMDGALVRIA